MSMRSQRNRPIDKDSALAGPGYVWPLVIFAAVILISYGYEIFSFNLSIDEDITAANDQLARFLGSISEGRWSMSLLWLILPNPVTPAVSTAIAVGGSAVAWWLLSRHKLRLTPWQSLAAAAAAGTVPTLAFMFSFSTIAFAVGIANLLVVGFFAGLSSPKWWHKGLAVAAGAAAVGVYDTFALALAAVGLALVWQRRTWTSLALAVGGTALSYGLATAIVTVEGRVFDQPRSEYVRSFIDLSGLAAHPLSRLRESLGDVWSTITLSEERFGIHSPWLAVLLLLLVAFSLLSIIVTRLPLMQRLLRVVALGGVVALPVAAEAITAVVPLRSMIYLPIIIIVLFAMSVEGSVWLRARTPAVLPEILRTAVAGLILLAVLGNAVIANRLYSISTTTYNLDQQLAFDIGQEKDILFDGNNQINPPAVVIGTHTWPAGSFTAPRETFGGSMLNYGAPRSLAFLRAHGVLLEYPTEAQTAAATALAPTLPRYPEPGWVSMQGDVLVINFGTTP